MNKSDRIDEDFICGCGLGRLIPVAQIDGLYVFKCNICGRGGQLECPICHCPRTLWTVDKQVCFFCGNGPAKLCQTMEIITGGKYWPLIKNLLSYLGARN